MKTTKNIFRILVLFMLGSVCLLLSGCWLSFG